MATKNWNAGIIRPIPVAPTGPYQDGAAPGVWTLDQVSYWQKQGLWPIAGNAAPVGLFAGGYDGSSDVNVIEKVLITSLGNSTDVGDLSYAPEAFAGAGSSTTAIFGGGNASGSITTVVNSVNYSSLGNATLSGSLGSATASLAAASNYVRSIFGGGLDSGFNPVNTIVYLTNASVGTAVDFGDLAAAINVLAGCSNVNGGVQ